MNLYFAEHSYQAEDILTKVGNIRGNWIALGPSAMHYLSMKAIPYTIPEDYCSREEVEEECVSKFKLLNKVYNDLDDILLENYPFLKKWNIRPFLFHLWQIGMIVDALVSRTLWLKKILEKFPKAKVYVHLNSPQPWAIFGLGFNKKETLWGKLLALQGWENEVVTLPDPSFYQPQRPDRSIAKRFTTLLRKHITSKIQSDYRLKNAALSFRHGIPINYLRILFPKYTRAKVDILALSGLYDWQYLLPKLSKQGVRFFFLNDRGFSNCLPLAKNNCCQTETEGLWNKFYLPMKKDSIDYLSIIKDRICWIIQNSPEVARQVIHKMEELTSNKNFRILISGTTVYFTDYVVKQYFQQNKIPVFGWQHGSVWYDRRITQRGDLTGMLSTSVFFAYGDGTKRACKSSALNNLCKVESIGSISLDKVKQEKNSKINSSYRILYVITNYNRNGWYCGFTPPFSDRLYFKEQSIIIKGLKSITKQMDNVSVAIKLYPGANVLDEDPPWVNDLKDIKNIKLIRSELTFVELLNKHDAVLIDTPTTTLLQAIATKLPVFVLTSIISPPRSDLSILKKRAVCAESAEGLMNDLGNYLKTEHYHANAENREFLKLYGTYKDDGESDSRAEAIVKRTLDLRGN